MAVETDGWTKEEREGAAAAQQLFFQRSSEDVKSWMHFLLSLFIIFGFEEEF